jgi:hypothetical protein
MVERELYLMKIHSTIEIAAVAEKIWPFLVEPEKIIKWGITLKKIRYTGEQHSGLNTTFYFEERALGRLMKLNFIVTEWIENRKVAFKMTSGNLVKGYSQTYTIEKAQSGCRFTCLEDVKMPFGILGRFAGLFRRSVSEAHLRHMLVTLKGLAEA